MPEKKLSRILKQKCLSKEDLIYLLSFYNKKEREMIFDKSRKVKLKHVGNKIYLRGLIEYSNICRKNCSYCGIRAHNSNVIRYTVNDEEVIECAKYALEHHYSSIVIQSGEVSNEKFTDHIVALLNEIHRQTGNKLKITLSCGEQSKETYEKWFDAGAERYLLRIESSRRSLFERIHPNNNLHAYENRMQALQDLKDCGYQVGTGIMVGLPDQSLGDLAEDLLFFKSFDIDMAGIGPYVEHIETPLYDERSHLLSQNDRFDLCLLFYAILRIMMPEINIAATTALDAIAENGRIKALDIASNVLMPNLTPNRYLENYHLYNNKPDSFHPDELVQKIEQNDILENHQIAFGEVGSSKHFSKRKRAGK